VFPGAMRHRIPPLDVAHREPAVAHSVLATADPTLPEVGSVSTNGPRPTDRLKAVPSLLVISVSDRKARYYVDSGRWRSGFRKDVDQDYEVMPITIPTRCRSQIATASEW